MKRIIKSELFKLSHKREIYCFIICLAGLSLLFSLLLGTNSSVLIINGLDKMGGMFFMVFEYAFLSDLFLIQLFISTTVSGIWAAEFHDGTIANSINVANSRRDVYVIKSFLSFICSIVYIVVLMMFGYIFYESIGRTGKYYTSDFMYMIEGKVDAFFVMIFLMVVFTCSLTTLLSMTGDQKKTMVIYVVILILMKILEQIESINEFLPSQLYDASNVFDPEWNSLGLSFLIIIVLSGGMYAAAYWFFKKKNIS